MEHTVIIWLEGSETAIFLFKESRLVGGWRNNGCDKAAEIAAEVIKCSAPDVRVIVKGESGRAKTWWDSVPLFDPQSLKGFGQDAQ